MAGIPQDSRAGKEPSARLVGKPALPEVMGQRNPANHRINSPPYILVALERIDTATPGSKFTTGLSVNEVGVEGGTFHRCSRPNI